MAVRMLGPVEHGAGDICEYTISWHKRLSSYTDAIDDSTFVVSGGGVLGNGSNGAPAPSFDAYTTRVWLVGGAVGAEYKIKNTIDTLGGRRFTRTLVVEVHEL